MALRLNEDILMDPAACYHLLAQYKEERRLAVHYPSIRVLEAASAKLPKILLPNQSVSELFILQFADALELYGKQIHHMHVRVAKRDITLTTALIFDGRHGLTSKELKDCIARSSFKGPFDPLVGKRLVPLSQFLKPEIVDHLYKLIENPSYSALMRRKRNKGPEFS